MEVSCPRCAAKIVGRIWASVNVTIDPELISELVDGTLNCLVCPMCGAETRVIPEGFIFHDMARERLVYVAGPKVPAAQARTDLTGLVDAIRHQSVGSPPPYMLEPEIVPDLDALASMVKGFLGGRIAEFAGVPSSRDTLAMDQGKLACQLSVGGTLDSRRVAAKVGTPVPLWVRIRNEDDRPIRLLSAGRIEDASLPPLLREVAIEVRPAKGEVTPRGLLVYRPPDAGDTFALAPGEFVSARVDLGFLFDLSRPGTYEVAVSYEVPANLARAFGRPIWTGRISAPPATIDLKRRILPRLSSADPDPGLDIDAPIEAFALPTGGDRYRIAASEGATPFSITLAVRAAAALAEGVAKRRAFRRALAGIVAAEDIDTTSRSWAAKSLTAFEGE